MPRVLRPLPRFLLTLAMLLAFASGAEAHAQLQGSDPTSEAVVVTLPEVVTLAFSEPVAPLALRWLLPDGSEALAKAELRGNALVVSSVEGGEGSYLLTWRVASSDGHPVSGVLVFAVGAPSRGSEAATPDSGPARFAAAGRFLLTLLLVLGVGAAVFDRLVTPLSGRTRRLALLASGLVLPAAALALGLHGLDMLGLSPFGLATASPWETALGAPVARSLGLTAIAGVVALVALRLQIASLALLAWGLAALSFALSGHAAEAPPRWLAGPAVALHALALIFWIGALLPLSTTLRQAGALGMLRRFSGIAVPMVVLLTGSGAALTVVQAGSLESMLTSDWGLILGVKLALVSLIMALALWNRLRLTPALAARQATAPLRLRRSIMAELVLAVAVLALASAFRLTPPPRILAASASVYVHMHGTQAMADIEVSPGRTGQNRLSLSFADGSFNPLDPLEVQLSFTDPARGLGPIQSEAHRQADGSWQAGPITLPGTGPWELVVDVLISDFVTVKLTQQVLLAD